MMTPEWDWLWYIGWAGIYIALMYYQHLDYKRRTKDLDREEARLEKEEEQLITSWSAHHRRVREWEAEHEHEA